MKILNSIRQGLQHIAELDEKLNKLHAQNERLTVRRRELLHEHERLEENRSEGAKIRRGTISDEYESVSHETAELSQSIQTTEGELYKLKRKLEEDRVAMIEGVENKLKNSRKFRALKGEIGEIMALWLALYGGNFNDEIWLSELFNFDIEETDNSTKAKHTLLIG